MAEKLPVRDKLDARPPSTGAVVIAVSCFLCLALFAFGPALAHSWYEAACCSGVDCHPVADGIVSERPNGDVEVQGYGVLNHADSRLRWSRDTGDHVCESPDKRKLLCVYRRPPGT
jgi:hypothetical protein